MHFEFYKNILVISNYRQIKQLTNDLIEVEGLSVYGSLLKVIRLDKDKIAIKGEVNKIILGE